MNDQEEATPVPVQANPLLAATIFKPTARGPALPPGIALANIKFPTNRKSGYYDDRWGGRAWRGAGCEHEKLRANSLESLAGEGFTVLDHFIGLSVDDIASLPGLGDTTATRVHACAAKIRADAPVAGTGWPFQVNLGVVGLPYETTLVLAEVGIPQGEFQAAMIATLTEAVDSGSVKAIINKAIEAKKRELLDAAKALTARAKGMKPMELSS